MKTVFVSVFQGVEFRNIVRTDICRELIRSGVRLVLFTNSAVKRDYYQREFGGPNVVYEVVEGYVPGRLEKLFSWLKFNLINTATMDIKRRQDLRWRGGWANYILKLVFNRLFARRPFRRVVRWLDWLLVKDNPFGSYLEKYQPDLVLLAHLFSDLETAFLRGARRRGIYVVGLVNSWDKLTSRCMIRLKPDVMVVHNGIIQGEVMAYVDMPAEDIFVSGVPHFDYYLKTSRSSRAEFFERKGLKPHEKIVLFCPAGTTKDLKDYLQKEKLPPDSPDPDTEMIILLDKLLASGQLGSDLRLVVRFPPNDDVVVNKGYPYRTKVIFQTPGLRFSLKRGQDWDMDERELRELADTLFYASVVVTYPSTMVIDAAVFDRPIVNVNIDFPGAPRGFLSWFYDVTHYQPVLKSGAVKLANTESELEEQLRFYLASPAADSAGRRKLVAWECGHLDGRAGERVAQLILSKI